MEMQMEYSLEKNVSISSDRMVASDSVSLPRLDNPTGACPTHRRQWADFLVSLMAPLHRHRLRAVMFCSEVPIRDTHKSPTNCLPGCGHAPRSAPNLERHGSSKMQTSGWLEMPYFLTEFPSAFPTETAKCEFLIMLLIKIQLHEKGRLPLFGCIC